MKKKFSCYIIFLCLIFISGCKKNEAVKNTFVKISESQNDENCLGAFMLSDESCIMYGFDFNDSNKTIIVRVNQKGNILFRKKLPYNILSACITKNDEIILLTQNPSGTWSFNDSRLSKWDKNGNGIWEIGLDNFVYGSVVSDNKNNIFVYYLKGNALGRNMICQKFSETGSLLDKKSFSYSNFQPDIQKTITDNEGNSYLTGYFGDATGFSTVDVPLCMKISSAQGFNISWTKNVGDSLKYDVGMDICLAKNNHLYVAGNIGGIISASNSTKNLGYLTEPYGKIFVNEYDTIGNFYGQKIFNNFSGDAYVSSIRQTADGGFIICGTVNLAIGYSADQKLYSKIYLLKVDGNLQEQWSKSFPINCSQGADAFETADGGYLICGSAKSFNSAESKLNFIVIKTDANGNY